MTDAPRSQHVIIGVGNPMRGDDGVGPAVIEMLAEGAPIDADLVVLDGESARVIDAWSGRSVAVVVDAVRAGAPPGTIHVIDTSDDRLGDWNSGLSSHGAGLSEAVAMARVVARMPARLVVFGVEAERFDVGQGLSIPVAAALAETCDQIRAECHR